MRIYYTHRTQGVGAEGAHIKGMFEAFQDLGFETSMFCLPGCNPCEQKIFVDATKKETKGLYHLITEKTPQIIFEGVEIVYNILLFARLGWACLRARPNMVYERYALNTFAPSLVCRLLGIKHVLEVNDSVVIERSRPLRLRVVSAWIEGICLRSADLCITITERFRQQLLDRFGMRGIQIQVFTNAVSRRRFDQAFDKKAMRSRIGLGASTVLGATGQFLEWHGLDALIECMGPVAQEQDLRFLFVGDGPARADVMAKANSLGIADRVHFTGMLPIDSVAAYLAVIDIAVIPKAAAHASPMKLIEYMAMGLPIVAPNLPSIQAALIPEMNLKPETEITNTRRESLGRIFPVGEMLRMGELIQELIRDKAGAISLGKAAQSHVFSHLTWDIHAQEVMEILGLKP